MRAICPGCQRPAFCRKLDTRSYIDQWQIICYQPNCGLVSTLFQEPDPPPSPTTERGGGDDTPGINGTHGGQ